MWKSMRPHSRQKSGKYCSNRCPWSDSHHGLTMVRSLCTYSAPASFDIGLSNEALQLSYLVDRAVGSDCLHGKKLYG
ncbi:MAG: hypothetical protein WBF93_06420, partial [Pirellulales bacterium]